MPENITIEITIHTWTAAGALVGLFFFGLWYALLMGYLERREIYRGLCAPIVALGATVTLLVGFLLPTHNLTVTLFLFAAFAAPGLPIMIASLLRFVLWHYTELGRVKAEAHRAIPDG